MHDESIDVMQEFGWEMSIRNGERGGRRGEEFHGRKKGLGGFESG